jgi:hypothetical protein
MSIIDLSDFIPTAGQKVLQEVINATWDLANTKSSSMSAKFTAAASDFLDTTAAPTVSTGEVDAPLVTAPNVHIPETLDVADVSSIYTAEYQQLMQVLETKFAEFITTRFPDDAENYAKVEARLVDALENGGLAADTEDRIYDSQRSAILEESSRAADTVLATFAARRYPVPPGAALGAVREIQQKAQSEIAKAGGALAALKVEMEKFTVEKMLGLRQLALGAAGDYIKALVAAPEISSKVANIGYDAQAKLIAAAADFYRADISAAELSTRVGQFNVTTALDAATKNQASQLTIIDAKLKALLAEAQSIAQEATSLFNNLNASSSISATDSVEDGL